MKYAAVILSILALVITVALVAWWQFGGFYTLSVINIFNLQSRLAYSTAGDSSLNQENFGGAALLSSAVAELKKSRPEALVTESGDLVMGPWWRTWQGEPEFAVASMLGVEAGTIGNHELDLGQKHLKKALDNFATFPILLTNITFDDPDLEMLVEKRAILSSSNGVKVGLFSLAFPSLLTKTKIGDSIALDRNLVKIAERTVKKLKSNGAQAIVLLTHASLLENIELASEVDGISMIISGDASDKTEAEITWVHGPGGWPTAVATGGSGGRSLSAFTLTLHRGRPVPDMAAIKTIKLSSGLKANPEVGKLVGAFNDQMNEMLRKPIGFLATPIDARRNYVSSRPAPIGEFIADAYRWKTGADIAVINAGGIRGDRIFSSGPITLETVMELHPFQNQIWIKEMKGAEIRRMLEFSASALIGQSDDYNNAARVGRSGFLHFSGLCASFSLSSGHEPLEIGLNGEIKKEGTRVKFSGLMEDGFISPLNDDDTYTVAMPDFIGSGGDKYKFLSDLPTKKPVLLDYEAVADYIVSKNNRPLNIKSDSRLSLEDDLL